MKRAMAAAVGLSLAVALTGTPSQAADDVSATYVAFGAAGVAFTINGGAAGVPAGVGGFLFPADGKPKKFKLEDVNGTDIGFILCQETTPDDPADTGCGNGEDPLQSFCSDGSFQDINSAFRADLPTWLFVENASLGCQQVGTVGTATMRYF